MTSNEKSNSDLSQEIVAQKEYISKLENQVRFYRSIFEVSTDAVFIESLDGDVLDCNETACKMFGISKQNLTNMNVRDLLPDDVAQKVPAIIDRHIKDGQINVRTNNKRGDGSIFPVEVNTRIVTVDGEQQIVVYVRDITTWIASQKALAESEGKFRTLSENIPGAIYLCQGCCQGEFLYFNENIEKITGYSWRSILDNSINFRALCHPDDIERICVNIDDAISRRESFQHVFRLRHQDGGWRWIEEVGVGIYEGDELKYIEGYLSDRTDYIDTENALIREKERLRITLQSIGDAVIATDRSGNIQLINHMAEKLTGWMARDVIGKPLANILKIIKEGSRERYADPVTRVLKAAKVISIDDDTILIRRNGEERIISNTAAPIWDEEGGITGVILIFRDITKEKQNQTELALYRTQLEKQVEERTKALELLNEKLNKEISERIIIEKRLRQFKDTVDSCNFAFAIVSLDGTLEYINHYSATIHGYAREEISGDTISVFHNDEQMEFVEKIVSDLLRTDQFPATEVWHTHRDGSVFPMMMSGSIIRNDDGEPVNLTATAVDISDLKKAQEVLHRVSKLESIGILAGGIAHDFNNILFSIWNNIALAKMSLSDSQRVFDILTRVEEVSSRANELTQQLITFAKGGHPVKELIDIQTLVKDSTSFALQGSNLLCKYVVDDDLPYVKIDPGQITQVISNLVINAQQAMEDGGTITISIRNETISNKSDFPITAGDYIRISVEDTGEGVPPENIQKIFDPFFSTKEKGSGLGLATAHSIVKNHHGHILINSEIGSGTKIIIYLPASEYLPIEVKEKSSEMILNGKANILIMDDDEMICESVGDLLASAGYSVSCAVDGEDALTRYKSAKQLGHPFDLVMMDLTIPGGLGGKETIKLLLEYDPNAIAIVASGYSMNPVISRFQDYGFKGVIVKPYKISRLYKLIADLLGSGSH